MQKKNQKSSSLPSTVQKNMHKKDWQHSPPPSTGRSGVPTLHFMPETVGVSALPAIKPSTMATQPDEPLHVHFTTTGKFMKNLIKMDCDVFYFSRKMPENPGASFDVSRRLRSSK